MAQGSCDDHMVLGEHGNCEPVRTMGAPPQLQGAVQEVNPPWLGQRTGDSWLHAFAGLTLALWAFSALGTSCLSLYSSIPLSSSSLCCLDLKGSHSWRAGPVQRGYCRLAVSQPAASATLPSGSDWLDSCSGVSPSLPLLVSVL